MLPPFCENAGLSNSNSGIVNDATSDFTTCLFKSCKIMGKILHYYSIFVYKNTLYERKSNHSTRNSSFTTVDRALSSKRLTRHLTHTININIDLGRPKSGAPIY